VVDGEKPGVDSRDEGKHNGRHADCLHCTFNQNKERTGLLTVARSSHRLG